MSISHVTKKACACDKYRPHPDNAELEICQCGNHVRNKIYTLNAVKALWKKTTRNIEMVFGEHGEWLWRHRYTKQTAPIDIDDNKGIAWIQKLMKERTARHEAAKPKHIVI